ncbi:MAG: hypothetical protein LWX83_05255 [Anaerolineae bacterium]|nr:hypothetical protein [Anaerolineae bacterium]
MKKLLFPLAVITLVTLACQFTPGGDATATPVFSASEAVIPTKVMASAIPTATALPELDKPAVDEKTSSEGNYHDEFGGKTDNWTWFFVTGNTQDNAQVLVDNNRLKVQLAPKEEAHLKMFENTHSYQNVKVTASFENFGSNTNGVSVLCRVSDKGWYEFRVSTGGLYSIMRYDQALKDAEQNPYITIASGGSSLIKTGLKANKIAMECTNDGFRFFVNDVEIKKDKLKIPNTKMDEFKKLGEGTTGLGVYAESITDSPVKVEFTSFDAEMVE